MNTVEDFIKLIPRVSSPILPAPDYTSCTTNPVRRALAVESMRDHMTDEGWQLMLGLQHAGYELEGYKLGVGRTDVNEIIKNCYNGIVILQDKREWDCEADTMSANDFREPKAKFRNVQALKSRTDLFKLTILKDAQQMPHYHRESAEEIGCHAWITYYHPKAVKYVAPYIRGRHLVRTYHTVDKNVVPAFDKYERDRCLLSGAHNQKPYPLRHMLFDNRKRILQTDVLEHPGYHRNGCQTPKFLDLLSHYKVSICTCSRYAYALRKIIESTACGCRVITNLPVDEVLPYIDDNLVRIPNATTCMEVSRVVADELKNYDPDRQRYYARLAQEYYDYRLMGIKLAQDIETLRKNYKRSKEH